MRTADRANVMGAAVVTTLFPLPGISWVPSTLTSSSHERMLQQLIPFWILLRMVYQEPKPQYTCLRDGRILRAPMQPATHSLYLSKEAVHQARGIISAGRQISSQVPRARPVGSRYPTPRAKPGRQQHKQYQQHRQDREAAQQPNQLLLQQELHQRRRRLNGKQLSYRESGASAGRMIQHHHHQFHSRAGPRI